MSTTITRQQQRRDTTTRWATYNPVLLAGELGYDTDLNRLKVGDGISQWTALSFADEAGGAEAAEAAAIAAAADAASSAAAAEAARDDTLLHVPSVVAIVPEPGEEYQATGDDLTVINLIQTGDTGPTLTPTSDLLVCTVTCLVLAVPGCLIGVAIKDGASLTTTPGSLTHVKTAVATTVTVTVTLDVDPGEVVEVVPVMANPFGEGFVNVGRTTPALPLPNYGPLTFTVQQAG